VIDAGFYGTGSLHLIVSFDGKKLAPSTAAVHILRVDICGKLQKIDEVLHSIRCNDAFIDRTLLQLRFAFVHLAEQFYRSFVRAQTRTSQMVRAGKQRSWTETKQLGEERR
jgi:hypothetical protein